MEGKWVISFVIFRTRIFKKGRKQQYCGTPCINLAWSVCVHWSERCSYDVMNTEQFSCGQNNIKPAAVFIPSCLHDHCIVRREPGKK